MARPLRLEYPGACYHVVNRGNQRQVVFRAQRDYALFVEKLGYFAQMFGVEVRCYCLMPNHFHLYVCTPEANVSRFMQSLLTSFTLVMNRRYSRSGHLFQGRFKAWLVEEEVYGSRLSRYIHLNPIRVQGAAGKDAEALRQEARSFLWSSYGSIIGLRRKPQWLARDAVLRRWGQGVREQQQHYAEYVERGLLVGVQDALEAEAIHGILGSEGFIDKVRRLVAVGAAQLDRRECGEQSRLLASYSLSHVIAAVCAYYGESAEAVPRRYNRGNEARQMLLYLAATHCRGRRHLTDLAADLGPISLGALTRAREKVQQRAAKDAILQGKIFAIEAKLASGEHDLNCKS